MKKNKNFKRILRIAALVMLLSAAVFSLNGCWWVDMPGESIDDFWYATVEKGNDGKYVNIWGLTDKGIELSETQTEATIPETIGGYPVKYLSAGYEILYGKTKYRSAKLGSLKRMIIEPYVRIGDNFFGNNELDIVELKSEGYSKNEVYYTLERPFGNLWGIVLIVPDSWANDFSSNVIFKKSEVVNGCLIRDNIFCGYIGTDANLVISEGVTEIASDFSQQDMHLQNYYYFIKYPIVSVRFPDSISRILASNIFSSFSINHTVTYENEKNYAALTTVYVSSNTIIEDGAFQPEIEIIRY